jgi:adenylyltransferase/sulfurtransferase
MAGESFSSDELLRYSRQLALPSVGLEGQERLRGSRVVVVGAGGLGSPAALYLAAAGVGTIGLVDPDRVDATNLHRQVLYGTSDIGESKVERARSRLASQNPHVEVRVHATALTSRNALDILQEYDIVLDGTDSFSARYLVNDACVLLGRPNVYASVLKFDGQLSVFGHRAGPCYRCLYPEPPPPGSVPSCAEGGVLGVLPGIMGLLQATEAIKLILGLGDVASGRLLLFSALRMEFRSIGVRRDPACPMCGTREISRLIDYDAFCGVRPSQDAVSGPALVSPAQLQAWRSAGRVLDLIDVREPWEFSITRIPGARLIPLADLEHHVSTLGGTAPVVVYCHHGVRSNAAAARLHALGIDPVFDLAGGIDRYSREVDPSLPRY